MRSPYKGLLPYTQEDRPYFFGRDGDREIVAANLKASRLTVLYGVSGVGKSSLLRAGVLHDINTEAARDGPRLFRVDVVKDSCPQQQAFPHTTHAIENRESRRLEVCRHYLAVAVTAEEVGTVLLRVWKQPFVR